MPEIETNKDKAPESKETHSTATESAGANAKEKPKESVTAATPQKSIWDLPDGELSEVFDSEGHRNRINHY
jgi:hypothetical protein